MNYYIKEKLLLFTLVFSLANCFFLVQAQADELQAKPEPPILIQPIFPENQRNTGDSFFNLHVKPGMEQTIEIELTNNTDEAVYLNPDIVTAKTNSNGVIDYTKTLTDENETHDIILSDITHIPSELVIPIQGKLIVPITIKIPDITFDGIALGAINFHFEDNEQNENRQFSNNLTYSIGIVLSQNEEIVSPELELKEIVVERNDFRNHLKTTLENNKPTIINDLTISAKIYKKNEKNIIYSRDATGLRMAPNSNFVFPIDITGEQALLAGTYTLKMIANTEEYDWEWSEDFTITDETVKSLEQFPLIPKRDFSSIIYISLLFIVSILIISIAVFKLKKRKK